LPGPQSAGFAQSGAFTHTAPAQVWPAPQSAAVVHSLRSSVPPSFAPGATHIPSSQTVPRAQLALELHRATQPEAVHTWFAGHEVSPVQTVAGVGRTVVQP